MTFHNCRYNFYLNYLLVCQKQFFYHKETGFRDEGKAVDILSPWTSVGPQAPFPTRPSSNEEYAERSDSRVD